MLLPSWIGLLALRSSTRSRHRTVCSFAKLLRPLPNSRGCSTASARSSGLATIAGGRRRPTRRGSAGSSSSRHPRSQSWPVGRRKPSRSADRPLMAPARFAPSPLISKPALSFIRDRAYFVFAVRVSRLVAPGADRNVLFFRSRAAPVAAETPLRLQSHPCYVVPQTSRWTAERSAL